MKTGLKNKLASISLATVIIVGGFASNIRPANATVAAVVAVAGAGTGNAALAALGGFTFFLGLGAFTLGRQEQIVKDLSIMSMIFGIIVLDKETHTLRFPELSAGKAVLLKISPDNAQAYNEERAEIEATAQSINQELAQLPNPTAKESAQLWAKYSANGRISNKALSAVRQMLQAKPSQK